MFVIDCLNTALRDEAEQLTFFGTTTANLMAAEC